MERALAREMRQGKRDSQIDDLAFLVLHVGCEGAVVREDGIDYY